MPKYLTKRIFIVRPSVFLPKMIWCERILLPDCTGSLHCRHHCQSVCKWGRTHKFESNLTVSQSLIILYSSIYWTWIIVLIDYKSIKIYISLFSIRSITLSASLRYTLSWKELLPAFNEMGWKFKPVYRKHNQPEPGINFQMFPWNLYTFADSQSPRWCRIIISGRSLRQCGFLFLFL